jgi:hypothetical protein
MTNRNNPTPPIRDASSAVEADPRILTLEETGQVSGACLPLIVLCVACAVLLAHD